MKKLVIFLSILMLVASAQAKVLTAKMTVDHDKFFSNIRHGWVTSCSGVEVKLKYNPTTDRGYIEFGESCVENADRLRTLVRVYDADGFQINAFNSERFESFTSYHIMATDLTEQERKAIRKISIDFFDDDSVVWLGKYEVKCPTNRELNEDDGICERKCDDNHIYDSETDKCVDLYDSKETAELVLDDNGNVPSSPIYTNEYPDQSGEWCQKADGEWYFDNNVKDGKCPKVKVRKDPERESVYGNEPSEKAWSNSASATYDAQYNNASGQWECTQPFHHDGYGHCIM